MTVAHQLAIRPLTRAEMDLALDWAGAEGWNPGLTDATPFHAADPEGFLVGEWRGEPIALVSAVRYGADTGFVGFYIVKPGWRGQGHGWAVWQAAMVRLAGRNVALDGVPAQQDNYRRSGFNLAWRNIRYQGEARPAGMATAHLVDLTGLPFATVAAYDRASGVRQLIT
jgi:ribosomal protein S18 acetylase RimI-like enzyme